MADPHDTGVAHADHLDLDARLEPHLAQPMYFSIGATEVLDDGRLTPDEQS
jgi:hypothetical protein